MEFVAPLFDDMKAFISRNFDEKEIEKKIEPGLMDRYFGA
jgi:hypothetical protein